MEEEYFYSLGIAGTSYYSKDNDGNIRPITERESEKLKSDGVIFKWDGKL